MANWAKQAAEQFLHIDGVKNRVDPLDSDDPYRPDSPSILKPSGSFVAAQVVNVNVNEDAGTDKSKSGRKPRRRRRSSVTWGDDDDGALVIPGAVIVPDGPVADSSAQHEEEVQS